MKETFITVKFQRKTLAIIEQANEIVEDFQSQGFTLTLRQLYYQFVSKDLIPNTKQSYDRLGYIIDKARLTGYLDWDAIEDRTRNLEENLHLTDPRNGLELIRDQYGIDMWANQDVRVEVWIEKEALAGVIAGVCGELDVPYFACRGYVSQSEQWRAYRRHSEGQERIVLHLGDHDPSGIDMTRDNQDRLDLFHGIKGYTQVERIALNMDQIEEYNPPPNFAKEDDSRFKAYQRKYGTSSWELDALAPRVIVDLIRTHVDRWRDMDLWKEREAQLESDLTVLDNFIEGLE